MDSYCRKQLLDYFRITLYSTDDYILHLIHLTFDIRKGKAHTRYTGTLMLKGLRTKSYTAVHVNTAFYTGWMKFKILTTLPLKFKGF